MPARRCSRPSCLTRTLLTGSRHRPGPTICRSLQASCCLCATGLARLQALQQALGALQHAVDRLTERCKAPLILHKAEEVSGYSMYYAETSSSK